MQWEGATHFKLHITEETVGRKFLLGIVSWTLAVPVIRKMLKMNHRKGKEYLLPASSFPRNNFAGIVLKQKCIIELISLITMPLRHF